MGKLLTVSVAAYNVQSTLQKALDSFVHEDILPFVQVIVVDDGSNDETAAIAMRYVQNYPDAFQLIQKPNGGYGSTINASIALATGTYFRLLDGDDWFDAPQLQSLLRALATTCEDIVFSSEYKKVYESGESYVCRLPIAPGKGMDFSCLNAIPSVNHHQTVFRTERLLDGGWHPLLEHTFYTDELFMMQGFIKSYSIAVLDCCPYCYRLGVIGQSVSVEGYAKHFRDGVRCHQSLCDTVRPYAAQQSPKANFLLRYVANSLQNLYGMFLCLPANRENKRALLQYHRYMVQENPHIYTIAQAKKIRLLRYSRFMLYRPMAWAWKRKLRTPQ